jgi:hypothetical protein
MKVSMIGCETSQARYLLIVISITITRIDLFIETVASKGKYWGGRKYTARNVYIKNPILTIVTTFRLCTIREDL